MRIERRLDETRAAWLQRLQRQRADDERPGGLAQFFYDLTTRIGERFARFARRVDADGDELKQD